MQIFKAFFKIAMKYKSTTITYFSVFLVLVVLMGMMAQSSEKDRFSASSVNFTVVDEDHSKASEALVDCMSVKHKFVELPDTDTETLQDNLYYENVKYIIFIPKGYEENLKAGKTDNLITHSMRTDSASGYFFDQDLNAYFDTLNMYIAGGYDLDASLEKASATVQAAEDNEVEMISFETKSGKIDDALYYFFKYYAYAILSVLLMGLSPILITFHKKNIMARLDCSALPKQKRNFCLMISGFAYAVLLWGFLMIFGTIYYGPSNMFSTEGLLCLLNSFVYMLVMIVLAVLIGSFNLGANGLNLISNIIGLGSSFLCGIFVPLWVLSDSAIAVGRFFPAYWYVRSCDMIAGFDGGAFSITSYWSNIGIQLLFALAFLAIYGAIGIPRRRTNK